MAKKTRGLRPAKIGAEAGPVLAPAAAPGAPVKTGLEGGGTALHQGGMKVVAGGSRAIGGREVEIDAAYYLGDDAMARAARLAAVSANAGRCERASARSRASVTLAVRSADRKVVPGGSASSDAR